MKKIKIKITAMVCASLLTAVLGSAHAVSTAAVVASTGLGVIYTLGSAHAAPPAGYCDVMVCNKLERFTFSPWRAIKDRIGEQCIPAILTKSDAVVGKVLDSSTRFYQGGFNLTKKSVTRVKKVNQCSP